MPTWSSSTPRFAVEARAAIQTHLAALFTEEERQQEPQPAATEVTAASREVTPSEVVTSTVPISLPVVLSEAEQAELAQDNAARHDWIAEEGRQQREVHGLYQRTADFKVSTIDPDATPMRLKGGGTHLGYHVHYVVDGGKARVILQVLVTPSEVMDNQQIRRPCANAKCGWSHCLLKPKTGMGCAASACGCSGGSTLRACGSRLDKTSNACSRNEDGGGGPSQ